MAENKTWRGKTGGTQRMQKTLIRWFRYIDTRLIFWLTIPWVIGSIIAMPRERKAAYHYWRRRHNKKPLTACLCVWKQFYAMGHVVLDRFAAFAGQHFDIQVYDENNIMHTLQHGEKGFVILSSHVGNQELAGYFVPSVKPLHILIYLGDTATMNRERERLFATRKMFFLPMQTDGSHIFEMHEVLQKGEALSIHADRMFSDTRTITADFLGAKAVFPQGPFRLAAVEEVPVVTMFMLRTGHNRYQLRIYNLSKATDKDLSSRQLSNALLQRYVHKMEQVLRDFPEQWFNFFEFWTEETANAANKK